VEANWRRLESFQAARRTVGGGKKNRGREKCPVAKPHQPAKGEKKLEGLSGWKSKRGRGQWRKVKKPLKGTNERGRETKPSCSVDLAFDCRRNKGKRARGRKGETVS